MVRVAILAAILATVSALNIQSRVLSNATMAVSSKRLKSDAPEDLLDYDEHPGDVPIPEADSEEGSNYDVANPNGLDPVNPRSDEDLTMDTVDHASDKVHAEDLTMDTVDMADNASNTSRMAKHNTDHASDKVHAADWHDPIDDVPYVPPASTEDSTTLEPVEYAEAAEDTEDAPADDISAGPETNETDPVLEDGTSNPVLEDSASAPEDATKTEDAVVNSTSDGEPM